MSIFQPSLFEAPETRTAPKFGVGDPLWIAKVQLDPRIYETNKILSDAQRLKSWILKAFGDTTREHNGMLYSVDALNNKCVNLYIQSHTDQNWWFTTMATDLRVEEPKRIDHVIDQLPAGAELRFNLDACITEDVPVEGRFRTDARGRQHQVTRRRHIPQAEKQLAWLAHTLQGAAIITWLGTPRTTNVVGVQKDVEGMPGNNKIAFKKTRLTGALRIEDPAALALIRRRGIGPEKAYGCGLLHLNTPSR